MSPRRPHWVAWLVVILALAAWLGPTAALAQTGTPPATPGAASGATAAATPAAGTAPTGTAPVTPGTPTPTRTPTVTPSPTATRTELQARLALAQTYLAGRDYDRAADLFAEIAADTRGNLEALQGLQAALDGRAANIATMVAPLPTEAPTPVPAPETLASSVRTNLLKIVGLALAAILAIIGLYLLAQVIRWAWLALREIWYLRVLPLLGRPAIEPGYLISEFGNTLGTAGESAARIVPLAITEKLNAWNQLVRDKQVPIEPAPGLDLGGMAWLSVLWRWILPPPRGYRVDGLLLRGPGGTYQLGVQRASLTANRIDRSATFASALPTTEEAFHAMAGEAAKWLVSPVDMEATAPMAKTLRELGAATVTPSVVFDRALELLLPVRQEINQGNVNHPAARQRMAEAAGLIRQLPSGSPMRQQLDEVMADLGKSVPGVETRAHEFVG